MPGTGQQTSSQQNIETISNNIVTKETVLNRKKRQ